MKFFHYKFPRFLFAAYLAYLQMDAIHWGYGTNEGIIGIVMLVAFYGALYVYESWQASYHAGKALYCRVMNIAREKSEGDGHDVS